MQLDLAAAQGGGKGETAKQPCKDKLVIARVPYSPDRAQSGVEVKVKLPDGRELADDVVVEDVFVVAIGDSFASGESNPDRPVSVQRRARDGLRPEAHCATRSRADRQRRRRRLGPAASALPRPTTVDRRSCRAG